MMAFRLDGVEELKATLGKLADAAGPQSAKAITEVAELIMAKAKDITPVYVGKPRKGVVPGALRASGHVEQAVITQDEASVQLGFGGPSAPYALIQHERTDFHHAVGQAKYLETPLKELAAKAGLV